MRKLVYGVTLGLIVLAISGCSNEDEDLMREEPDTNIVESDVIEQEVVVEEEPPTEKEVDEKTIVNDGVLNFVNSSFVVSDDEYYYVGTYSNILKSKLGQSDFIQLLTEGETRVDSLNINNGKLYFNIDDIEKVMNVDGSELVNYVNPNLTSLYVGYYVIDDKVYYTKYGENYEDDTFVCSSDLDGSNEVQLSNFKSDLNFIYDGYIYYYDNDYFTYKMKLDGSENQLVELESDGYFATVAGDLTFYWKNGALYKVNLVEGTEPLVVYEIPFEDDPRGESHLDGVNNTEEYIVLTYTDGGTSGMWVIDFDGNILNEIEFDLDENGNTKTTNFVCILDDYIYFKYQNGEEIYRVYFDSQEIEVVE